MSGARLFLFDDRRARWWAPFTLTRPAGELLYGCMTLRARAERVLGLPCSGHITRRALAAFEEPDAPPVVAEEELDDRGMRIFLLSRAAPEFQAPPDLSRPGRIMMGDVCVGRIVEDGAPPPDAAWFADPNGGGSADAADSPGAEVPLVGEVLERPWDLLARNAVRVHVDIERIWLDDHRPPEVIHVARTGGFELSMAHDAEIDPGVVVDTRDGPIRLDSGVRVEGPARLVGPLFVGPGSVVLGGTVARSSLGPVCRVRGEVTDSVFLGFDNKAHDGYMGHAILGQWVNLGAATTNSDLKNNYGTVRVWTLEGEVDTGLLKVGCFLGDHVKTGIGTLLNTGTVVGAGSNLFGGVMPPKAVPPFSWGSGSDLRDYRLDRFLETAQRAMARRDRRLSPGMRVLLTEAWRATRTRRNQ
ncbi:MAG: putative sugar nucleotidyl transferase [Gemmatimonadota bacterium]